MINRNAPAFAHNNLTVALTPTEGINSGKPFTFGSAESVKLDAGEKAAVGKGLSVGPVYVVSVAAEPAGEMKLSISAEATAALKHLGNLGVRFTVDATFVRAGVPTIAWKALGCVCDGGWGGFDSSADAPPSNAPKFKMSGLQVNGKSVFGDAS